MYLPFRKPQTLYFPKQARLSEKVAPWGDGGPLCNGGPGAKIGQKNNFWILCAENNSKLGELITF
jgi:hypothetical protein